MTSSLQKSSSLALLCFGTFILATSLMTANKISVGDGSRLMTRRMYVGEAILPDHVLYPALMIGDRVKLETASTENQVLLRVEYADRRFRYARELLEKEQPVLALTTLTKSQKYLFAASNEILANPSAFDTETIATVTQALDHSMYRLELFDETYQGDGESVVKDLLLESSVLLQKMNELTE